jgi:hypothetical protein
MRYITPKLFEKYTYFDYFLKIVIPANAGIQFFNGSLSSHGRSLDSRMRGNDTANNQSNHILNCKIAKKSSRIEPKPINLSQCPVYFF